MERDFQAFEAAFSPLLVENPKLVIMGADGTPIVTFHTEPPKVEVNPAYEVDEAAKVFWECVRQHMPLPPPPADGEVGW
jgi:hypothetical protein